MRVVFLGPPGSGKGTQAERLSAILRISKISTGDALRESIKRGDELGRKAKVYVEKGELVPDDIILALVEQLIDEAGGRFLLDGFPRNLNQAKSLDEYLSGRDWSLDRVIYLRVDRGEIVNRLSSRRVCSQCGAVYNLIYNPPTVEGRCDKCGGALEQRRDDTEDVILRRLDVYERETAPLIAYYAERGLVEEIDGTGAVEEVFERIRRALE